MSEYAKGRVVMEPIEAPSLRSNPLGDPDVRTTPVYLPPGYDDEPDRRYPAVFLLPGLTGSGPAMLNRNPWRPTVADRTDRLVAEGRVPPMILVLVDAFTKYGGSQYINSTATGRYEDYVTQDLVAAVDGRFRTLGTRDARGVAGKSSGGYGAMVLGMRHPDVFGAVACHSGDMYFEFCYLPDIPRARDGLEDAGGVQAFWERFWARPKGETRFAGETMGTLAMAACYSPNPDSPYGYDLPFDEVTGEIRDEVWARWLEHDPVRLVERHRDALRSLRLLYLDCGTRDQFFLHQGARIMARRLERFGVPHVHEEFDDTHDELDYRYETSLERMGAALAATL